MPTYVYVCENCGYEFEYFQKMSDEPLQKCPKCQGKVQRMIGAGIGLIFKGSGFYITDYKRKNSNSQTSSQNKNGKSNKGDNSSKES